MNKEIERQRQTERQTYKPRKDFLFCTSNKNGKSMHVSWYGMQSLRAFSRLILPKIIITSSKTMKAKQIFNKPQENFHLNAAMST